MKLRKVEVTNFRCIHETGEFEVGDVSCLVGKNESGKTALLQALYRLNPIEKAEGSFDVTEDYPRVDVEDYRHDVEEGKRKPAIAVKATFELASDELRKLSEALGDGVVKGNELSLSRGYDNKMYVGMAVDEKKFAKKMVADADLGAEATKKLAGVTSIDTLAAKIEALENADERLATLLKSAREVSKHGLVIDTYEKYLEALVPKFLYFGDYCMMAGQVNLNRLVERQENGKLEDPDKPLLGLLGLARLEPKGLLAPRDTRALKNKLEGAAVHLTKRIVKYWSQNKYLELRFDVRQALPEDPEGMRDGMNLWGEVFNARHHASTALGSRSRGFVFFFSFLAYFDRQKRDAQGPIILLLDEPGLYLHAKAQEDLLRFIEDELRPEHQVLYTTHSPFMVDPRRLDRVRILEDKSVETDAELAYGDGGTKVTADVLEPGSDSLFPLQGALGYELCQTLFVGPNCLVVEGPSDLLYLQIMGDLLTQRGRQGLSPQWTITPVGGAEKVPTFAALLGAQRGLKCAVLLDLTSRGKQKVKELYKRRLLKKKNVLTFAEFTGTKEADIEDMFAPEFYLGLVNAEFKDNLNKELTLADLADGSPRIVVRIRKLVDETGVLAGVPFNHYRPARYFLENQGRLVNDVSSTALDRFEEAFRTLNALL